MSCRRGIFPTIFLQRLFIGAILGPILPAFASIPSVLVGIKNPQTVGITWFFRISWDEQILPVKVSSRLVRMRSPVRIWVAAPDFQLRNLRVSELFSLLFERFEGISQTGESPAEFKTAVFKQKLQFFSDKKIRNPLRRNGLSDQRRAIFEQKWEKFP